MGSFTISLIDVLVALDVIAMALVAIYALNQGVMLSIYLWFRLSDWVAVVRGRSRGGIRTQLRPSGLSASLPSVTVQLPLYNERYVAERIIAAASALDYPRDQLHIQVLDDSTDDTTRIAQHAVTNLRERGIDIDFIHRDNRSGYKAGALANGLRTARGELIAIFDADFTPARDFLLRVILESGAFADSRTGFVQVRWGHINRDATILTRAQAIMLDMCFVIDQTVRSRIGLAMQFNGSGGVWRRTAIDAAGGWQADTLTEDLDLSYRAQLKGWRGRYLDGVVCLGELPEDLLAFKRQQARWARGGAQCLRKLAPLIVHSNMPALHKLAAFVHISGYFSTLPVMMLALVTPLLILTSGNMHQLPVWLSGLGLLPIMEMLTAQWAQGRLWRALRSVPVAVILGIGLAFSESVAVIVGLAGRSSGEFSRTPKSAAQISNRTRTSKTRQRLAHITGQQTYNLRVDWTTRVELTLGLYATAVCLLMLMQGASLTVTPVLLYALSFLGVSAGQFIPLIAAQLVGRLGSHRVESRLPFMK